MAYNSFLDENTSHSIQGSGGFANLEKGEMETFGRCGKGKGENSGLFQENFRFFSCRWFSMVLMRVYQAKAVTISGTDFHEVWSIASYFYKRIKKKSRRLP